MTTDNKTRAREQVVAIIAAHAALTGEVVAAAKLMSVQGHRSFAALLDLHRAELNVVIGEFATWAESFGEWAKVDVDLAIHPPVNIDAAGRLPLIDFEGDLRRAREAMKSRRTRVLAALADGREALRAAGLPVDQLTAYRRSMRMWAGEAVDLVTEVHRLALADRYLHRLGRLSADPNSDNEFQPSGATLLRQWMHELEEADREGELAFAAACGYEYLVERYRAESAS